MSVPLWRRVVQALFGAVFEVVRFDRAMYRNLPRIGSPTAPVPPQNLDAEESVLGAMMLSPGAIGAVSEVLSAGDFYRASHGMIYRAALDLYAKGEPVDAITLADELERRGELEEIGGRTRINELAALVPASVERRALRADRPRDGDAPRPGARRQRDRPARLRARPARRGARRPGRADRLRPLAGARRRRVQPTSRSCSRTFERITALYEAGADVTGIGVRLPRARPAHLRLPARQPDHRRRPPGDGEVGVRPLHGREPRRAPEMPVALFTLEMSKSEVTQRLMCSEAKVESQRLRTGKLAQEDWPRLTAACDKLAKAPIYVDDTGSITMMEIRSKARRLKMREPNLGLIIIDYLQLMTSGTSAENRVQEVSQISRSLKVLARDLDVPIIAISQLSRAVEQRHDKRPILSDLRESGLDRAGRRPRHVHLPRRVLQRRGVRPAGARRGAPGEAPKRADRHRQALVPPPVREVRRPGARA